MGDGEAKELVWTFELSRGGRLEGMGVLGGGDQEEKKMGQL